MSSSYGYGSVSVDIDVRDVLREIGDDVLKRECVLRGILPASADRKAKMTSLSLDGEGPEDVGDLVRHGDLEGALLHLERMLPRHLRVFADKLVGVRPC